MKSPLRVAAVNGQTETVAPTHKHKRLFATAFAQLLFLTLLLTGVGLVMVLSASTLDSYSQTGSFVSVFLRQVLFATVGLIALFVISRMPTMFIRRWSGVFFIVALGMQLLVFSPLGRSVAGNRNWFYLGPLGIQPSEILKLAMIVWFAQIMAMKRDRVTSLKELVWPGLAGVALAMGLVLAGHDLGTVMVMALIMIGCLFFSGVPMRFLMLFAGAGAAMTLVFLVTSSNRLARLSSWSQQGECTDLYNGCWQAVHGTWALAAGGIFGVGLGNSDAKWAGLPAAENDYVFAIIGEELGMVGAVIVILLFAAIAIVLMRLLVKQREMFERVIIGGVLVWIAGQAFINIAVVIGLAPVLGVPLPLISAGGSALISTLTAVGIVLGIAKNTPE